MGSRVEFTFGCLGRPGARVRRERRRRRRKRSCKKLAEKSLADARDDCKKASYPLESRTFQRTQVFRLGLPPELRAAARGGQRHDRAGVAHLREPRAGDGRVVGVGGAAAGGAAAATGC